MPAPKPRRATATPRGSVKSASRVLMILEYLADAKEASFGSVVSDLGLPGSSVHELLQTAVSRGFVELDEQTRMFRLGFRIWEVAQTYSAVVDLAAVAQPLMDRLRDATTETVQLARLVGLSNVYLAISESPHPMKLVSSVGGRLPAHATGVGKALLAGLDDEELARRLDGVELVGHTVRTIVDRQLLLRELAKVRSRGYAEDNEEYVIGCRCVAIPVRDGHGRTIAAMSVSVPTPRFSQSLARQARSSMSATVTQLEGMLARGG